MKTPFHREKDKKLVFPYRPLRDLVFVWPVPPPEKFGKEQIIAIPEQHRKKHHDGTGIVLAIGSGYVDDKGKMHPVPSELKPEVTVMFDIGIPWGEYFEGQDGKKHYVCICGAADIFGLID